MSHYTKKYDGISASDSIFSMGFNRDTYNKFINWYAPHKFRVIKSYLEYPQERTPLPNSQDKSEQVRREKIYFRVGSPPLIATLGWETFRDIVNYLPATQRALM